MTGAEKVALLAGEVPGTWIDLNGGPSRDEHPNTEAQSITSGGKLIWKKNRMAMDPEGGTHVFFQQRFFPVSLGRADMIKATQGGFEVRGSSMGYHYSSDGRLVAIAGARFADVEVVIESTISTRIEALEAAFLGARIQRRGIAEIDDLSEETLKRLIVAAEPILASTGDGRTFGFIWSVQVPTLQGMILSVEIDAATGNVLSIFDGLLASRCQPETDDQVAVGARSQGGGYFPNLPATEAPGIFVDYPGFTREAHRRASPEIVVLMGENHLAGDQCPETGDQFYRVFPLKSADGTTWYDDWEFGDRTIRGKSAADAMKNTILTLSTLSDYGWSSFDGHGGTARIVVDSDCNGEENNAYFNGGVDSPDIPADGVAICKRSDADDPQYSIALEIVAHEWGHGVIYHSADWGNLDDHGSLHEGFADLIGYGVQWYKRGSTPWIMSSEAGVTYREAGHDDGFSSYHRCDEASACTGYQLPHAVGNKIPVVFRMMAEGVDNPGSALDCDSDRCFEEDAPDNLCGSTAFSDAPEALGMDHAFQFLFDLLVYFGSPTTEWVDLPALATMLGGSVGCPYKAAQPIIVAPGVGEPECIDYYDYEGAAAAHIAFRAIGYPPNHELIGPCE